ncbi:nuclear transport factor 2 family protein [Rhodococcus chondri]|uniref:Nuclear transport factor 2 family protein n=1 Tax=Rhodococcus chondri TaxID=3065941 RepID=A0ABU7JS22_9NOCA|nr:nuclear transport factor 2 family protein [Rhodococcus sp. CC-R104]MEE2032557.1 nuclear transport factor 2 family protein [Rhodococcus sp. CC-R104]
MTFDTTSEDVSALEIARSLLHAADTDIIRFFGFFSADCVFRMGNNDPVEGSEAIQEWVASYLGSVAGMHHAILEQWCDGNVIALHVNVTYTMNDGTTFTLPAVTRIRIENEKVAEYSIFMDPSPVRATR